jgi:hypothetical protein
MPLDAIALSLGVLIPIAAGVELIRWRHRSRPSLVAPAPSEVAPAGSPAIGALLCADGDIVDGRALAATVLELARRGQITIHQLVGDHLGVSIRPSAMDGPTSEQIVLETLGSTGQENRESLWAGAPRGWVRHFRKAVINEARDLGLIDRTGASDPDSPIAMSPSGGNTSSTHPPPVSRGERSSRPLRTMTGREWPERSGVKRRLSPRGRTADTWARW